MKIEDGKIIEATEAELYRRWLADDWADFMPFQEFLYRMKQAGVEITEEAQHADGKRSDDNADR